jgi:hypothetical protein
MIVISGGKYYIIIIGMFTAMATLAMARPAKSSSVLNLCLKIITKK